MMVDNNYRSHIISKDRNLVLIPYPTSLQKSALRHNQSLGTPSYSVETPHFKEDNYNSSG